MSLQNRVRAINRQYRGERPAGWLTPEDYAQSERYRKRAGEAFGQQSAFQRAGAINRARARGIAGSPALEATMAGINQNEGRSLENIANASEDQLYRTRMGRESFDQNRLMTAWGSELGAATSDWQNQQAREAQFWNSLIPLAGTALDAAFGKFPVPAGNTPYTPQMQAEDRGWSEGN